MRDFFSRLPYRFLSVFGILIIALTQWVPNISRRMQDSSTEEIIPVLELILREFVIFLLAIPSMAFFNPAAVLLIVFLTFEPAEWIKNLLRTLVIVNLGYCVWVAHALMTTPLEHQPGLGIGLFVMNLYTAGGLLVFYIILRLFELRYGKRKSIWEEDQTREM